MLDECALEHEWHEKTHHYHIKWKDKAVYPSLPKGDHSKRGKRAGRAEIEIGHVRKMVRFLEIDIDCANRMISQLNLKQRT